MITINDNILNEFAKKLDYYLIDTPNMVELNFEAIENIEDSERINHTIQEDDTLVPKGTETKRIANFEAILLLKKIEAIGEDYQPTLNERTKLTQFTGWGGLSDTFSHNGSQIYVYDHYKKSIQSYIADNLNLSFSEITENLRNYVKNNFGIDELGYVRKVVGLAMLSENQYKTARISTINAHYTSKGVIKTIWEFVKKIGYRGGLMLENSAGIGHFIGLMPLEMRKFSKIFAIEKDEISAKILTSLYRQIQVFNTGFETAPIPMGQFNLCVGNVPFGRDGVFDSEYKEISKKFSLHNYFIAKTALALDSGGVAVLITSTSTLDGNSSRDFRIWLTQEEGGNCDFLGAVRLPSITFKENAGTEVTTDLVVIRKRNGNERYFISESFTETETLETVEIEEGNEANITINEYYLQNQDMMLGKMKLAKDVQTGGLYRSDEQVLEAPENFDIVGELTKAFEKLAQKIGKVFENIDIEKARFAQESADQVALGEIGDLQVLKNKVYIIERKNRKKILTQIQDDEIEETILIKGKKYQTAEIVSDYIELKNGLKKLFLFEKNDFNDENADKQRKVLNSLYDSFTSKYGSITNNKKIKILEFDRDFNLVESLEKKDSKGNYQKAEILMKRVVYAMKLPDKATTLEDAFNISMNYKGYVDIPYIAYLLGENEETVKKNILTQKFEFITPEGNTQERPLVFLDPKNKVFTDAEEYLSGDIKEKLKIAESFAKEDSSFNINVEYLREYYPKRIPLADFISDLPLAGSWIPSEVIKSFIYDNFRVSTQPTLMNFTDSYEWNIRVIRNGDSFANLNGGIYYKSGRKSTYEINGVTKEVENPSILTKKATDIIEIMLNNKIANILRYKLDENFNKIEKETKSKSTKTEYVMEQDDALTEELNNKRTLIEQQFQNYVASNINIGKIIEDAYNETFNHSIDRTWLEPKIERYPNQTQSVLLRPSQKIGVKRALREATGGFLGVGVGKTFTIITSAMEAKRMGLANKPMIVVLNPTLKQFVESAKFLYPNSRILHPNLNNFTAKDRIKMLSKMATQEWDLIIIPQSQFNMIADSPSRVANFINAQIAEIDTYESNLSASEKENKSLIRSIQSRKKDLIQNINTLTVSDVVRSQKTKDIARRAQRQETQILNQIDRKTDNFYFEDLGVDWLSIDEFHNFKKIGFWTNLGDVKGIDTTGSKRALSCLIKIRYIQEKKGEKNTNGWTGTPISNTIAEMWTMAKFFRPSILDKYNCRSFDAFVANFAKVTQSFEMDAGGNFKLKNRLSEFQKMKQLLSLWKSFAYVVLGQDVLGKSKEKSDEDYLKNFDPTLNTPLLKMQSDGKRGNTAIIIPKSDEQKLQVNIFREILEFFDGLSGMAKRAYSYFPLVVYGLAKRATTDLRLLPEYSLGYKMNNVEDSFSKTNYCAKQIAYIYQRDKGTTQAVFCDGYKLDEYDRASDRVVEKFNVFKEIKRILIQEGIPEKEISIVTEVSPSEKDNIISKVITGEIRIVMGTSQTLGTGVNMQQRLIAIHNIDATDRPMDMEQRIGRIVRIGNENPEVDVFNYAIEKTLDAVSYKRLEIKQFFINQVMSGKVTESKIEDELDETGDFFASLSATLTGSTTAVDLVKAKKTLNQIKGLIDYERGEQIRTADELNKKNILATKYQENLEYIQNYIKNNSEFLKDFELTEFKIEGNEKWIWTAKSKEKSKESKESKEKESDAQILGNMLYEVCQDFTSQYIQEANRGNLITKQYGIIINGSHRASIHLSYKLSNSDETFIGFSKKYQNNYQVKPKGPSYSLYFDNFEMGFLALLFKDSDEKIIPAVNLAKSESQNDGISIYLWESESFKTTIKRFYKSIPESVEKQKEKIKDNLDLIKNLNSISNKEEKIKELNEKFEKTLKEISELTTKLMSEKTLEGLQGLYAERVGSLGSIDVNYEDETSIDQNFQNYQRLVVTKVLLEEFAPKQKREIKAVGNNILIEAIFEKEQPTKSQNNSLQEVGFKKMPLDIRRTNNQQFIKTTYRLNFEVGDKDFAEKLKLLLNSSEQTNWEMGLQIAQGLYLQNSKDKQISYNLKSLTKKLKEYKIKGFEFKKKNTLKLEKSNTQDTKPEKRILAPYYYVLSG